MSRHLTPSYGALTRLVGVMAISALFIPEASARSFELRTVTVGQATQYQRSDGSIDAPRRFDQVLNLRAFDLLDHQNGDLNAQLMIRYATDLSLAPELRPQPAFALQSNALTLDLASVQWRPWSQLTITAGRQWRWGALGLGDFDGVKLGWRPELGELSSVLELWAGRALMAPGALSPDTFDIQGLPEQDQNIGPSWLWGARAGIGYEDHLRLEASYQKRVSRERFATTPQARPTWQDLDADERVAGALTFSPTARLSVTTAGTYHLLLDALTQAKLDLAWRPELVPVTLGLGASRRRPWFDMSSIFNIFEPRPHDDLYATATLPHPSWSTQWQLRLWRRTFHGATDKTWLIADDDADSSATGAALAHSSRLNIAHKLIDWRSTLSLQLGDEGTGGDQLLADTALRMPALFRGFFINARLLGLMAWHTNHRYAQDERTLSATLGLDYPVLERGTLSGVLEQRLSTNLPSNTTAYVSLTLEVWP